MIKYTLLFLILIAFTSCQEKDNEDIKIGFVAGLTGKYSSLGSDIRDGFMLGFDEINYKINNHKVKIIQKDDKQDATVAKDIIKEFIKKDIKLIVGNATSSMTKITVDALKNKDDFLIASVTASASDFTKKDDNFIRIQVEHNEKRYFALKKYIVKHNIKKVFYVYDENNLNYAKGYFGFFQDIIRKTGGYNFIGSEVISSDYKQIINKLKNTEFDMILIVANSSDTANLIQTLKINNIHKQILISGWANTNDFVEFGGKAIEGVILSTGHDKQSKEKNYLNFVKKFNKKYNTTPSVFSLQGYEMAQILIANLKKTSNISELKHYILEGKIYKGLQGYIEFDEYGDVNRDYFIMKMVNGKFVKIIE